jgi:hypothetical protein
MDLINRSAAIAKPRQPYLEWCRQDDAEGLAESVFESLRAEPHVYLLPEYEDPASQQRVLSAAWPQLFEAMLEGWVTDEAQWPQHRTRAMFEEWFEVRMCSVVGDLDSGEPLERV